MSELHKAECTIEKSELHRNYSLEEEEVEEVYIRMRTGMKQTGSGVFYLSREVLFCLVN